MISPGALLRCSSYLHVENNKTLKIGSLCFVISIDREKLADYRNISVTRLKVLSAYGVNSIDFNGPTKINGKPYEFLLEWFEEL